MGSAAEVTCTCEHPPEYFAVMAWHSLGLGTIGTLALPVADAYVLKLILWNDDECVEVLSNVRKAATGRASWL
ncbi:hypothetical protein FQU96_22945 [Reyranella sp. CPCC 100927]|nr:hypothetical protein FQU96_22945 [Reyranella sp. CPCC 100927]